MGAAVKLSDGSFQVLTGNQIAAVLVNYLLTAKKNTQSLPENGAIVTSIVSSRFASIVAAIYLNPVKTSAVTTLRYRTKTKVLYWCCFGCTSYFSS
ncbi:hypothetical protein BMS81_09095 [Leuconostoc pseudomesenteroides]|nr:hypothetical protein BMS81_09095 [Leuconostoc pseudomesenteroides]